MRSRSPGYPGIALGQAIVLVGKIHSESRTNPIDREAAAKDMGFAGLTGSSTKALADLAHYGLIEKAGKGSIRVSQRAVDILYPESAAGKAAALNGAAFSPSLFEALHTHFHDGVPSENALKGYLMRQHFASGAIPLVVASYLETSRLLQQAGATEGHGHPDPLGENGRRDAGDGDSMNERGQAAIVQPVAVRHHGNLPADQRSEGVKLMSGERELTTGLLSKGAGFRLIVHGKVGEKEIDRLIRKLQLDKEILADSDENDTASSSGDKDSGVP